jgi:hypothetical protein
MTKFKVTIYKKYKSPIIYLPNDIINVKVLKNRSNLKVKEVKNYGTNRKVLSKGKYI